ncbi:MAG: Zn-dependent oligopeptidase [Oligoflexales bacterium]|nr:Zn-dependent oligopeptidase [Oligoflexales bacterium]
MKHKEMLLSGLLVLGCGINTKKNTLRDSVGSESRLNWSLTAPELNQRCAIAIDQLNSSLNQLSRSERQGFDAVISELEYSFASFYDQIEPISFYGYSSTEEELRKAGMDCEQKAQEAVLNIFTREDLFKKVNNLSGLSGLVEERQLLLQEYLDSFFENGLQLSPENREKLKSLNTRLIKLSSEFAEQLNNDDSHVMLTKDDLSGLSDDFISGLEKDPDNGLYKLTMKYPHYRPAMELVKRSDVRKRIYKTYQHRGGIENSKRLGEAIQVRAQIAALLGFKNHAEKTLKNRMAKTPAAVVDMLDKVGSKLKDKNKADLQQMLLAKRDELKDENASLEAWDVNYYSKLIKKRDHEVDSEKVQEYFPAENTIDGMFEIYQTLLGVEFKKSTSQEVWYESVSYYDIIDSITKETIAGFFMDLYPREGKYGHAAAFTIKKGYQKRNGQYSQPISAIVANFTPATQDKPSLFKHSEVETLFHEFGHIMHQTLTKSKYASLSGTSVKRDFVEAPSQMLEHWVWQKEILKKISSHYKTGEALPDDLLNKMIKARKFNIGYLYTRQLFFARIDMKYHQLSVEESNVDPSKLYHDTFEEISTLKPLRDSFPEAGFGHLMGGYDAGYYGYLWSEIYAADMFTRFDKEGYLNPKTGADYRTSILEKGGSKDPFVLIQDFLGKKPDEEAFFAWFE